MAVKYFIFKIILIIKTIKTINFKNNIYIILMYILIKAYVIVVFKIMKILISFFPENKT